MKIPKVCLLTTSYPRTQEDTAGVFVERLVKALSKQGVSADVVVPFDKLENTQETRGSTTIHRYKYGIFVRGALAFGSGIFPNLKKNPLRAFQIPGLLLGMLSKAKKLKENYDILHAQWIFSGLVAWIASELYKKPFILTLRGEDVKLLRLTLLKPLFARCFKKAKKITVVSEHFYYELTQKYKLDQSRIVFIPNGVEFIEPRADEVKNLASKHALNESSKYLLYVGRIIPLKRIELLFDILKFTILNEYTLLICGPIGDETYCNELRKKTTGIDQRVKFLGSVDPGSISTLLRFSSAYLSASSYEGRSNSLLEALAAGKVCFVSNIPGHAEVIKDGYNGYLFDSHELEATAKRIANVLSNSAIHENVSRAARVSVAALSWERCAEKYIEIYKTNPP